MSPGYDKTPNLDPNEVIVIAQKALPNPNCDPHSAQKDHAENASTTVPCPAQRKFDPLDIYRDVVSRIRLTMPHLLEVDDHLLKHFTLPGKVTGLLKLCTDCVWQYPNT